MSAKLAKPCSVLVAAALATALAAALPLTSHAKTFRFARAADMSTWDVHAQNVGVNNTMHAAVYDTLIEYDSKTFKPRGSLASEQAPTGSGLPFPISLPIRIFLHNPAHG